MLSKTEEAASLRISASRLLDSSFLQNQVVFSVQQGIDAEGPFSAMNDRLGEF